MRVLPADAAATIDRHDLAGDEGGICREEERGARDIFCRARAFERRSINDFFLQRGIGYAVRRPHHRPRSDRVNANVGAELASQRFREHDEAGLGNRIGRIASQRPHAMNVDDVEDQAVRQTQGGCSRLREEQRRFEIRADQIVPIFERDFSNGCRVKRRRVVDQNIELAEMPTSLFHQVAERGRLEQIAREPQCAIATDLFEFGAQFLSRIERAMMMDHYICAGRVQLASDRSAYPSCASGNQSDFAREGVALGISCHGDSL